ncbi:hypothetical protein H4R20_005936 [Coemansia guatemalensis]|uniref:Glycosyl transferase family 25 domain-containing protein n=1 Tax=Coemansia guatemalensis TaxID=2761395 RepID=A0A9W8LQP0_9FUNG|nr:hypothetical protein H4R20_005936 [Coemansia guatemalensis]
MRGTGPLGYLRTGLGHRIGIINSNTFRAAVSEHNHRFAHVDDAKLQLEDNPSLEYSLAFTDHIYCLSKAKKLGRRKRMSELFRYMHLDSELSDKSHFETWRDIISKGYRQALVVEDDIDFEVDAVDVINRSLKALSSSRTDWDVLYVGHCSMEENIGASIHRYSRVHRSTHPFCTSAYVLSLNGARKLYAYFAKNYSPSHSLDVQLVALVKRNLIESYSIYPPIVYQRRDLYPSDDGVELKITKLFKNSAWDEALTFDPRLEGRMDALDEEYHDPPPSRIPSWMEDPNNVK